MKKVVNVVEKLVKSPTVPSLAPLPGLSITPADMTSYSDIARAHMPPRVKLQGQHVQGHGATLHQGVALPQGVGRQRSRSPQVKRNHEGEEVEGIRDRVDQDFKESLLQLEQVKFL